MDNKKDEFTKDELEIIKKILKEKNAELHKLIYEDFAASNESHYSLNLDSLKSTKDHIVNILSKLD